MLRTCTVVMTGRIPSYVSNGLRKFLRCCLMSQFSALWPTVVVVILPLCSVVSRFKLFKDKILTFCDGNAWLVISVACVALLMHSTARKSRLINCCILLLCESFSHPHFLVICRVQMPWKSVFNSCCFLIFWFKVRQRKFKHS